MEGPYCWCYRTDILSICIDFFLFKSKYMYDYTFFWFFFLVALYMFLFEKVIGYLKFKVSKIDLFEIFFPCATGELTLW